MRAVPLNMFGNRVQNWLVAAAALVLSLIGVGFVQSWGGVDALQATTSSPAFAAKASELGNDVRLASWADSLVFVPGYLLLLLALFHLAETSTRAGDLSRWLAAIGGGMAVAGAVADQVENAVLQLSLGAVDVDADVVDPAGWLIATLRAAYWVKFATLTVAVLALMGLGALLSVAWVKERTRPVALG